MLREGFGPDTFVHVVNRGAHQMPIVRDNQDRWRFLRLLRYVNDVGVPRNWEREITPDDIHRNFSRPDHWATQDPYVSIIAFCLMDNHFHLLMREVIDGGISKFMQRISRSMAAHHNARYNSTGALFQGRYRARVVESDEHLQYLATYINIKNPFERFPGGIPAAVADFNRAYKFAIAYPFASTADFAGERLSSILDHPLRQEVFETPAAFQSAARELMLSRQEFVGPDPAFD